MNLDLSKHSASGGEVENPLLVTASQFSSPSLSFLLTHSVVIFKKKGGVGIQRLNREELIDSQDTLVDLELLLCLLNAFLRHYTF